MTSISQPLVIPGFRSETITVKGVRLHYWIGGDPHGQPVLLWHGFLSTSYEWHQVAPALAQAGLAVLIPDMRGFGDSDKPAGDVGYDNRAMAEEFRALVQEIGFGGGRPLILAAHDMGAPPALIWAADHPQELVGLLYIEGPVMLAEVLQKIIAYTPQAMAKGSMWWWILPLAPGIPERLVVGNERAFLTWFYEGEPLTRKKVSVPTIALGGSRNGLGAKVGEMVKLVAEHVEVHTLSDSGHFLPEEQPDAVIKHILSMAVKTAKAA
jgi:pimeloyl-ACP methyl ester carboxylesterase